MNEITVIGLGAASFEQLQIGVYQHLKQAKKIFARTIEHPVIKKLQEEGIKFESFDEVYESYDSFHEVYEEIAGHLIEAAKAEAITYAVPGHPLVAEKTVQLLIEEEKKGNIQLKIKGGQSFLDSIFSTLKIDPIEGFQLVDGTNFSVHQIDMKSHLLIAQVYDAFSASEVKLTLMEKYRHDYPVTIVTAAGSEDEIIKTLPLNELDHEMEINNLTTIYVPPVKTFEDALKDWTTFREIIATLRGPNGCPWDKKQTHESLKKYLIEEAHEFLTAVDNQDDHGMVEELGDILLQVFLHAQIGEDEGYFNLEEILETISSKMIRRHPHVFGDVNVENAEEVVSNWEQIKQKEKGERKKSILDGEFRSNSSLLTSYNYQKKAASVGFDWPDVKGAWDKFLEECREFQKEASEGNEQTKLDEFGDVLFTLVNIARFYNISPEEAMVHANKKFARRFQYVEKKVNESGKSFKDFTLQQLDKFWDEAKLIEKGGE